MSDITLLNNSEALIVVDVQNDFFKDGSLAVPEAELALPFMNLMIDTCKRLGQPIIYTKDWHPQETPHFEKWPVHCVAGTSGAKFHPDLVLAPEHYTVWKGIDQDDGYSAFSQPSQVMQVLAETKDDPLGIKTWGSLETLLVGLAIQNLVIIGLATDFCVLQTALDARKLGYTVLVSLECTAPVYPDKILDTLQQYLDAGVELWAYTEQITQERLNGARNTS